MSGRRRAVLLAALALAVPLPALAASDEAFSPVTSGPTELAVSTSLDSCGLVESEIVCRLSVSYNALLGASSYSASVTRADGSVVDYGTVAAEGTTLWVPYAGSGTYSVRVTAYGTAPEPDAKPEVITTEVSGAEAQGDAEGGRDSERNPTEAATEPAPRNPEAELNADADGTVEATPTCTETLPAPESPPLTELPEPPPIDVDPENPDEDSDGTDDVQERVAYDAAVAEQTAAAGIPQAPDSIECP
jgi:hypothetical protein